MGTYYGITPQASPTVIQQSYFRLARKLDPRNPENQGNERASAEYLAVQCAYRTLSNAELRCDYDRSLQMQSLKLHQECLRPLRANRTRSSPLSRERLP